MIRPDTARFGREWLRAPLRVGAVAPSGSALAKAMADGLSEADGPVIELGPGTGVFTRALLARHIPAERITAIEVSGGFASALALRFPGVWVVHGDAAQVRRLAPLGPGAAGVVVCGLPLLSMPPGKVLRILAGSFTLLRPGGAFRLFTYGRRCPVPGAILDRLGIIAQRSHFVSRNIPPATVYVLSKTGDMT